MNTRRTIYSCAHVGCNQQAITPEGDRPPSGWYRVAFSVGRMQDAVDVCPAHARESLAAVGMQPFEAPYGKDA